MIIIKEKNISIKISSVGQNGYVFVPYPETPNGYKPFLTMPHSGTANLLVADSQFYPIIHYDAGFPIRYIGYQEGTWEIGIYCYYIRTGMVDVI